MRKSKLKELIEENSTVEVETGEVSKFGIEQITNIHSTIETGLLRWDSNLKGYDPLVEIAKIAFTTEDEKLKFQCHAEIAAYKYPKVKSLEIASKQEKEITLKIEFADYAKPIQGETIVEEIEDIEEGEEQPKDMTDYVLKQRVSKDND